MHELSVTNGIFNVVLKHAHRNNVRRVLGVTFRIGGLSDLADEWAQHYFNYLSRGTVASGAKLCIERVPAVFHCQECQSRFSVNIREIDDIFCPGCRGGKVNLVSGRECFIEKIEVI